MNLEKTMNRLQRIGTYFLLGILGYFVHTLPAFSQTTPAAPVQLRDGQHDFDFNIGTWKTHISRLQHPLSGSKTWTELDGTVVVHKIWGGRAQIEELDARGAAGNLKGLTLFLYNPNSHQWTQTFANIDDGTLDPSMTGEFKNGRGEFFDQEPFNGRTILVRFVWSDITPNSHQVEQAFSDDGGKTWEPNFVATLTREKEARIDYQPASLTPEQHDFDWQIGSWKIEMSRLQHPLTGSTTWVPLNGTVVVRKLWGGRANLAEIEADGAAGHLEFLSLLLYNPQAHQWSLNFASSNSGTLSVPMIGEFKNGDGEFYDQEPFNGKAIFVRFVFSGVGHDEQAFSDDGGKTWETNWINKSSRVKNESAEAH